MSTRLTWFGHAAFCIETAGLTLLVDPFLDRNPLSPVKAADVKADFILVTHGHGDHLGDTLAIARRTGAKVIANAETSGWLEKQGLKTHGQHMGGGFNHPFGYLKLTFALHGSALPDGAYGGGACGFLLTTQGGKKIYLAGDTGLFGDMALIGDEGIDLAALPIGDNYTMGPADALRAVKLLRPAHVIPIHYNTFPLISQNAADWAGQVQAQTSTRVHVLKPGESLSVE